jgi:hypothetical protein
MSLCPKGHGLLLQALWDGWWGILLMNFCLNRLKIHSWIFVEEIVKCLCIHETTFNKNNFNFCCQHIMCLLHFSTFTIFICFSKGNGRNLPTLLSLHLQAPMQRVQSSIRGMWAESLSEKLFSGDDGGML